MQGDPNFREYLEAKFLVDGESFHRRTAEAFREALGRARNPAVLDVGTGTGSMIRRIIEHRPGTSMAMYGVDANRDLLEVARHAIIDLLKSSGFAVKSGDQITSGSKGDVRIDVHLVPGDLFDRSLQSSLSKIRFDAITAHAFMDIVPIDDMLALFSGMLARGGLFYSTINYDGTTELFPFFEDRAFEVALLDSYNRSMDDRTPVAGAPAGTGRSNARHGRTGGSRTGSALFDAVLAHGFSVSGFGSSDWSVFPWGGGYTSGAEVFLNSLLLTMYEEGLRHPELDRYRLSAWYANRSLAVEERRLALMTHQTDILAVRR